LNELGFDDDGGSGFFSHIDRACGVDALAPGTYHVKIDEYGDDDPIPSYTLSVLATPCPSGECTAAPQVGCRTPERPLAALLSMTRGSSAEGDLITWRWKGGDTPPSTFGDPVGTDPVRLCVYDAADQLLFGAEAPAGGLCGGGAPCWKAKGSVSTPAMLIVSPGVTGCKVTRGFEVPS